MSLILASSKQSENSANIQSENPSSFTNFFRSPIVVEPDSEIAVQSVKLNRSGNVVVNDNTFFGHYFGNQTTFANVDERTGLSRKILIPRGTYNLRDYARTIQEELNTQYAHPSIYGNATVTLDYTAEGEEDGLVINFQQRDLSTTNRSGSLTAVPYFNLGINDVAGAGVSNAFSYTTAGVFSRTGASANGELNDASCVALLSGKPFALNNGSCIYSGMTSAGLADYAVVGLSRPNVQYDSAQGGITSIVDGYFRHGENPYILEADQSGAILDGFAGMPDYAVLIPKDGAGLVRVVNTMYDEEDERNILEEIKYWGLGGTIANQLTRSQFYASYDGVRFSGEGDLIKLEFKDKGKSTYVSVLDDVISVNIGQCFRPVVDTTYALYPFINIGDGSLTLSRWETNYPSASPSYSFPSYNETAKTYLPGSDMFSNESAFLLQKQSGDDGATVSQKILNRLASGNGAPADWLVDSRKMFWSVNPTKTIFLFSKTNASDGVGNDHVLTIGKVDANTEDYYLSPALQYPRMSQLLGYNNLSLLLSDSTDGYVSGDNTNLVTFTSPAKIQKSSISSFIRIPNLTHKSFNGAQQSMSKIVYQVPQFANDGSEYGPLYFEPGEKTYVSLNNSTQTILNSLMVQFITSDEKELDSLTGYTQVVFHIRKRK